MRLSVGLGKHWRAAMAISLVAKCIFPNQEWEYHYLRLLGRAHPNPTPLSLAAQLDSSKIPPNFASSRCGKLFIYIAARFSRRIDRRRCMQFKRANLALVLVGCAMAASAGCTTPLSVPFSRSVAARSQAATSATPPAVRLPTSGKGDEDLAADMAGVLDELEQVRAMDPAAEQKLRDELRRTPPDTWPLVAEQFRASLAYHQQLVEMKPNASAHSASLADYERANFNSATSDASRATSGALARRNSAFREDHLSAPIGALVDPQRANGESAAVLAQTMPYAMPIPAGDPPAPLTERPAPAEFAADGPTYPIAAQRSATAQPAAFDVPAGETARVATQALAKIEANLAKVQPLAATADQPNGSKSSLGSSPSAADENWQRLVQKASDDLSQRVVSSPATTAEVHQHVSLRMLRLLAGDTEKALEPIPHISPAEQDYWSRQIFAIATYLDHHRQPDDKRRAAASVAHLDEAVSHLRELGSLSLRNLSFCKNVYGYGAIEPYDTDTFTPGQQVSLYVEVENYHSKSGEKGFCTLLGATYELLDDKGKRVSGGDFPDVDDCCRSRRRDFHIQYGLSLPQNLAPGRYRLELIIKDRQSDKLGHATAPFEIRGGKK